MKLMIGNYKPLSYIYLFLKKDLERITRLLSTGGVKMADLGSAGCAGVRPLSRENLDEVLAATNYVRPIERTIIPAEEGELLAQEVVAPTKENAKRLADQIAEKIFSKEKEEQKAGAAENLVLGIPKEEYAERLFLSPWHGKPLYWGWKSWTGRIRTEYCFSD